MAHKLVIKTVSDSPQKGYTIKYNNAWLSWLLCLDGVPIASYDTKEQAEQVKKEMEHV